MRDAQTAAIRQNRGGAMRAADILSDRQLGRVDVYPVGFYSDLKRAWGEARLRSVREGAGRLARDVRRSWRRRSYWNGFLAEPYHMPPNVARCGRGFTRTGALRSLARLIAAAHPDRSRDA